MLKGRLIHFLIPVPDTVEGFDDILEGGGEVGAVGDAAESLPVGEGAVVAEETAFFEKEQGGEVKVTDGGSVIPSLGKLAGALAGGVGCEGRGVSFAIPGTFGLGDQIAPGALQDVEEDGDQDNRTDKGDDPVERQWDHAIHVGKEPIQEPVERVHQPIPQCLKWMRGYRLPLKFGTLEDLGEFGKVGGIEVGLGPGVAGGEGGCEQFGEKGEIRFLRAKEGSEVARVHGEDRAIGEFHGGDGVPLGGEGVQGGTDGFERAIREFGKAGVGGFEQVPVGGEREG